MPELTVLLSLRLPPAGLDLALRAAAPDALFAALREIGHADATVLCAGPVRELAPRFPEGRWVEASPVRYGEEGAGACAAAVSEALALGLVDEASPVLYLDGGNPLLAAEDLREALRLFRAGGEAVVSVSAGHGHPCQCRTPYAVVTAAVVPLADPAFRVDALAGSCAVASHPFPLGWKLFFVTAPTPSRCYRVCRDKAWLEALDFAPPPRPGECLLYHAGPETARTVFLPVAEGTFPGGLAPPALFLPGEWPFLAASDRGRTTVHLAWDVPVVAGDALHVVAFGPGVGGGSVDEAVTALPSDWRDDAGSFTAPDGRRFSRALATLCAGTVLVCMVRRESPDDADFFEGFRFAGSPWNVAAATGLPIRGADGRPVLGRQDFPPVLGVDASLACGRAGDLRRLEALIAAGGAVGLDLGERALRLRNDVDLLRVAVLRDAAGKAGERP